MAISICRNPFSLHARNLVDALAIWACAKASVDMIRIGMRINRPVRGVNVTGELIQMAASTEFQKRESTHLRQSSQQRLYPHRYFVVDKNFLSLVAKTLARHTSLRKSTRRCDAP